MARLVLWTFAGCAGAALTATAVTERLSEVVRGPAPSPLPISSTAIGVAPVVAVAADLQGHFLVHPSIDGRRIRMLVDTGASIVALSYEDAETVGIRVTANDFTAQLRTANGVVEAAPVRLPEIRVGDILVENVDAVVLPRGRLGTSLLGMSFLRRLRGFEISQGRLTLRG